MVLIAALDSYVHICCSCSLIDHTLHSGRKGLSASVLRSLYNEMRIIASKPIRLNMYTLYKMSNSMIKCKDPYRVECQSN